jgi:uncharacterized membrane protein (DUF2068 family)
MQRPAGITFLAIAYFLGGGVSFLISCLALAVSGRLLADKASTAASSSALSVNLAQRGNTVFWISLFGAGTSLFKLIAATGLWTLQPWGRQLALVSGVLNLLTHVLPVFRGAITPSGVLGLLVNGSVLLYLFKYDVRSGLTDARIDVSTTRP